jgi:class 3 adenylate cyclase/pimeloyl-ACP methyl ester carboxylesterase
VRPQTQYAQSGDVYVAYQVFGEGPLDLVMTATSNIEWGWEQPQLADYLRALGSFARVILFDRRGSGASDRSVGLPTLEERMDDLRAVMDAAESERPAIYAAWNAAPTSALFAATHPQRVLALVLWAPRIRGSWAPDYPWGARQPSRHPGPTWGAEIEETIRKTFPSKVGDEEFRGWLQTAVRITFSPSEVALAARLGRGVDARPVLPTILAPTLVIHRGTSAPAEQSSYIANQIPGSRFVDLGPGDAAPWSSDPEPVVSAIREFLTRAQEVGAARGSEPDRVLATILFTDIVGSTTRAVDLGDAGWRELLERHRARVRRELLRFRGRELDTAGDGFFAMFDGPARAIRCARAIVEAGPELGLNLRAGLHTGECEVVESKVAGIAVHLGARVAGQAEPGEVLVSGTVRDLVAGSGLEFQDQGETELKGIPGAWRLYAASGDSSTVRS